MRENHLRTKLERGEAVLNCWVHIGSSIAAEALAQQGFDSMTLDLQHGPLHYDSALPLLTAISTSELTPLARVPWNEPGIIMKLLDAGCYGLICPMVNTREQCEAFVGACRYPPEGYRSYGPTRARLYGGADYAANANATVLTFAMIETAEALDNVDEIMSVPGLDAVYVGPADLSQSLGGPPGADFEDGPVPDALEQIAKAAERHGIKLGLHNASVTYARKMVQAGFQFMTVQSDLGFLSGAARDVVQAFRDQQKGSAAASPY